MKIGYIGHGKKMHYIVPHKFYFFNFGEKGLCGKHGKIKYVNEPVTCWHCKRCAGETIKIEPEELIFIPEIEETVGTTIIG